jgi:hypothetical protein
MPVRCEGDVDVMEQIGERQEFEAELTRFGFRHEDFDLYVRRAKQFSKNPAWATNYAVRVNNEVTGKRNIYWGGPKECWVAQFASDLAQGMYGTPTLAANRFRRVLMLHRGGAA